jgi:cytochrome c551/c552
VSHSGAIGIRARRGPYWGHLAICAVAACATSGDGQAQFTVARATDGAKVETVSVFGIFRNGRLSPEAWDDFGAGLSAPFGQKACDSAYTRDLANANPELTSVVDDYAKENGVSDELLDRFAPLAKGDTIMVVAMTGQPAQPAADAGAGKAAKPGAARVPSGQGAYGGPGGGGGGGRGMGRGGGGGFGGGGFGGRSQPHVPSEHAKPEPWEISAWFYSVPLHHTVSQIGMTYSGQDFEAALKAFVGRLGAEMPGVSCRGWERTPEVDVEALHRMLGP